MAAGFTLQESAASGSGWLDVTNTPVSLNNRNQVILPRNGAIRFFRLKMDL
jgi:hypothetical protein